MSLHNWRGLKKMTNKPMAIILNDWDVKYSVTYSSQRTRIFLEAIVKDHPFFEDGKHITTDIVMKVSGRSIKTSWTQYILQDPSKDYMDWLFNNYPNYKFDPENPIKLDGSICEE